MQLQQALSVSLYVYLFLLLCGAWKFITFDSFGFRIWVMNKNILNFPKKYLSCFKIPAALLNSLTALSIAVVID